jgi:hypothetical protein
MSSYHHPDDPRSTPEPVRDTPHPDYRGTAEEGVVECEHCHKSAPATEMEQHEYRLPHFSEEQGWFHPWCWAEAEQRIADKWALEYVFRHSHAV